MNTEPIASTNHTPHTTQGILDITSLVQRGVMRARALGRPVLLRVHRHLSTQDPWLGLPKATTHGRCVFAWNRPELSFLALGDTTRMVSDGGMDQCAASVGLFQNEIVTHHNAYNDIPAWVGGVSFGTQATAVGPWRNWPGAILWAPKLILFQKTRTQSKQCGAILQRCVTATTNIAALCDDLNHALDALPSHQGPQQQALPESPWKGVTFNDESPAHFYERVFAAREAVRSGRIDKVVLARSVRMHRNINEGGTLSAADLVLRLRQQQTNATTFGMGMGDAGVFLGATPESLVRVQGNRVTTEAVAGTAAAGTGFALLHSKKDRNEHAWVKEAIRERLGSVCNEVHYPQTPEVIDAGHVQHLRTPFEAALKNADATQPIALVDAMHPTPAVAGWPEHAAKQWLHHGEDLQRGYYAGSVGWLAPNHDAHFVVAIRSGIVREGVLHAYAGAGIVAGSDPAAEWQETQMKLKTLLDATVDSSEAGVLL